MQLIRKIFTFGVFVLAIFLAVEITYRYYVVGPVALNPLRANSLNTLMRSEFVQLAEYPDIFFELKPNMDGWFKAVRFTTNSAGQADREYDQTKPAGARRVVVVGSSWTMPSGVDQEDAWHAVLEKDQTRLAASEPVEFINMGVELYGLRELVGTVKHKAYLWDPDLIVVAITTFTTTFVWEEPDGQQKLPDRAYPALQSYSLRGLAKMVGIKTDEPSKDRPLLAPGDKDGRIRQLLRAMDELSELQKSRQVPVVIVFLGYVSLGDDIEALLAERAAEHELKIIFANQIFPEDERERRALQISQYDRHPNAAGQRVIAEFVGQRLRDAGYLSGSSQAH